MSVATSDTWRDKNTGERREGRNGTASSSSASRLPVAEQIGKGAKVYLEGCCRPANGRISPARDKYTTEVVLQGFNSQLTMLDSRGSTALAVGDSVRQRVRPNLPRSCAPGEAACARRRRRLARRHGRRDSVLTPRRRGIYRRFVSGGQCNHFRHFPQTKPTSANEANGRKPSKNNV